MSHFEKSPKHLINVSNLEYCHLQVQFENKLNNLRLLTCTICLRKVININS